MDRGDPAACPLVFQHVVDTGLHFSGSLIGKGDRQDVIGFHALLFDQIGDAHRQNAGLS